MSRCDSTCCSVSATDDDQHARAAKAHEGRTNAAIVMSGKHNGREKIAPGSVMRVSTRSMYLPYGVRPDAGMQPYLRMFSARSSD